MSIDYIALALALLLCACGAGALGWTVVRHRLLDLGPLARHSTIEHMSDAMVVLDRNQRIVDLNPAARRLIGLPKTYTVGIPAADAMPAWASLLEADGNDTTPREAEVAVRGRDYELRISPVHGKDGSVTGRVLLLHDVTEQKQARETLQRNEEAIRIILENIEDGYYEIDRFGTMTRTTDVTAKIAGLTSKEEAVGRNFAEFTDAESAQRLIAIFDHLFSSGEAIQNIETPYNTVDGEKKWVEMSAALMRDATGKPTGFRGFLRDATERKRAEEELRQAKHAAEEASRAKGAFLATVSHELRTPLTSVLGFAKLIKRRLAETVRPGLAAADRKVQRTLEQVSDNVDIIVVEGERLTTLINDVLDLAKIESGRLDWHHQPIAVEDVIGRAVSATSSLSEQKGLKVEAEIEEALPAVVGDPDRLIQVVINLLSNAIKFTARGVIACRACRTEGALRVSVTDSGPGIAPEDQEKVFEQFVQVGDTLTDKPTGTGLGLPICKQIVEHHGGRIWVESRVGEGSNFVFTLPFGTDTATSEAFTESSRPGDRQA